MIFMRFSQNLHRIIFFDCCNLGSFVLEEKLGGLVRPTSWLNEKSRLFLKMDSYFTHQEDE